MIHFEYADDLGDDEYPDEPESLEEISEEDTHIIGCPACNADIYEDAPQCSHCGHYLTQNDHSRISGWWAAVTIAVLLGFLLWMFYASII